MANGNDPANPKKFRYTLTNGGSINDEVLFNSPEGWLQTNIKYARSKTYGGLLRSLTLPLKFDFKGAYLLRSEFYTNGLLTRVNLLIEKLVYSTWKYKQLYLGKIDFSKFADDQITGVTVNAIEKDITVEIDAYEDVQYAIPLTDTAIDVLLTPLNVKETTDFIFNANNLGNGSFPGLKIINNQQSSINTSVKDVSYQSTTTPNYTTSDRWFIKALVNTIVSIKIDKLIGRITPAGAHSAYLRIYDSTGAIKATIADFVLDPGTDRDFDITVNLSISILAGQSLFIYGAVASSFGLFQIGSGSISLSYDTVTPASHCKAWRASYIYDKLVQLMNGPENPVVATQSILLSGMLKNLAITCSNSILVSQVDNTYQAGDTLQIGSNYVVVAGAVNYFTASGVAHVYAVGVTFKAIVGHPSFTTTDGGFVRQITTAPQIILSFKDFFQSIYAIMGGQAALGLDQGVLCLEDLRYFYRQGLTALDLKGHVTANSFKLEPNLDFSFNTIKVGYNDQQYDAINGTQEVNSEQYYTTKLTNPKAELNLISPIRADPFGIEQIRIIPSSAQINSAASKSDNDNFFIWLKDDPEIGQTYYQPLTVQDGTTSYAGVDASYYNWKISPKQNLLRGGGFLASVLDKMSGYQITMQSALKNSSMVTIVGSTRVAESDPISISDLGPQIFIPYYVTINTGLEFNAQDLLDLRPYGEVWFKYLNVKYKGFINEVSVDAGQNSSQDFKLLLTPDMNTAKFIH